MTDEQGVPVGLASDYIRLVASRLSLKLQYVVTDSWQQTLEAARRGDVDVLPAMVSNGEAAAYFKASEPYLSFPLMVVVREGSRPVTDLHDLRGDRILANPLRVADETALRSVQGETVLPITSTEEGMKHLAEGDGDALFANLATADYYLGSQYRTRLRLAAPADVNEKLSVGVRADLAPLLPLINRALFSIDAAERQRIKNNWIATQYTFRPSTRQLLLDVLPYELITLAVVLALGYAYLRLRREVRMRRLVEKQLDDVATNLPAVVYKLVLRPDGKRRFLYVGGNPGPVIGMAAAEILGDEAPVLHTIHPDDRARLIEELQRSAKTITPLRLLLRARVDGRIRYVRSEARPRRDVDGSVYWSGFWSDITHEHEQSEALARAVETAERANEAKSRFLATMSHEIRTPMNGIIGNLELLEGSAMAPEQLRLTGMVNASAQSLMRILNDILDFSKVEAGELHIEMGHVDLRQLLDMALAAIASSAHARGLAVAGMVGADVPLLVRGDGGRIAQVLGNLLSNAVKFTQHGGVRASITLTPEQRVCLTVADTGVGIDEERQEDIWQPFVQSDTTITRRFGGTGLGLAICRQLVTLMHGSIELRSSPGKGTTVWATLPLETLEIAPMPAAALSVTLDSVAEEIAGPLSAYLIALGVTVGTGSPIRFAETGKGTGHVLLTNEPLPAGFQASGDIRLSTNPLYWSAVQDVVRVLTDQPVATHVGAAPIAPDTPGATAQGQALVVDDNPVNRAVLRAQLGRLSFASIEADSGGAALELLAKTAFDIVFTDLHMPGLDGIALVRSIRAMGASPPPVVGVTADVRPDVMAACMASGMVAVLAKPCVLADVRDVLHNLHLLPPVASGDAPIDVDTAKLLDILGSHTAVAAVLDSCLETTAEALARLPELETSGSPQDLGQWLHFVLGGLATIFTAQQIEPLRRIEYGFMTSDEPKVTVPADMTIQIKTLMESIARARQT